MTRKNIPFNKPFLTGKEAHYLYQAVYSGKISGNGVFTQKCQKFFEDRYRFKKCLLTTSCTDALEMASILLDIKPGDEVILPSYTFVSTANPFILRGAKLVFADSREDHPGIDEDSLEELITSKTKAIVIVHYGGVACDMSKIMDISEKHGVFVVEDAAQAIDSYYLDGSDKLPLGSIGHLAAFSFHETKNIISGEGGMLAINDKRFLERAEIIWEKGTNRAAFFRGEIDKYGWVDVGSSFLPSEIVSSFLYAQLEHIDTIQKRRIEIYQLYYEKLREFSGMGFDLPTVPTYATENGHIFYVVFNDPNLRTEVIDYLKNEGIHSVFHYLPLHSSPYFKENYEGKELINTVKFSDCLLRLPLFFELSNEEVIFICQSLVDCLKSIKTNS